MENYEKKYKEALFAIKQRVEAGFIEECYAESIFPELKESEDERIRRECISIIKAWERVCRKDGDFCEVAPACVAWLEKQGEQKPNPCDGCINRKGCINCENGELREVEQKPAIRPKFNIGEWVVFNENHDSVYQVEKIENYQYTLRHTLGGSMPLPFSSDGLIRLWAIQDAKDGDVLACESGWTCIFKSLDFEHETFGSYCFMDNTKWFCETGSECHTLKEEFVKAYNGKIYPATKEQRDQLKKAMKEAGYEWDADKKELKKIEQKSAEWSEEDEAVLDTLIRKIEGEDVHVSPNIALKTLKALKDRVQPKQEWSEEDEAMLKDTISCLSSYPDPDISKGLVYQSQIDWLKYRFKSLRPQNHWKPTEEQIKTLEYYMTVLTCNEHKEILFGLLEQIKKL